MRVIDLSHTIPPEKQVLSTSVRPEHASKPGLGSFHLGPGIYNLPTHGATRVEAPSSFVRGAKQMHEVAPDALIRDAVILDLSHKNEREPIEDEDIEAAEEDAGLSVRENEIALLMTRWDKHSDTPKYFSHHPGLTKSGAEFLEFKGVAAVGVDSPNIDHPEDITFPAHTTLLSKGILVVENLRGLDAVDTSRVKFLALPLRIQAGTGSFIRAIIMED